MAEPTAAEIATAKATIAAAAAAQGVGLKDGNDPNAGDGNPVPAPPSNDPPPPPEPTPEEKAAADAEKLKEAEIAAAKVLEDKAVADAADKTTKEGTPLDEDVWGSTGHEVADSVLQMLQNADVSPDDAKVLLFDAVQAGDLTKIDKAALEEKVGATKATLILAGVTTFVNDKNARNTQIVADIKTAAGGEENWAKMAAWGKANLPDADLVQYRGMIDGGGAQARFAVAEIAAKYNADDANTTLDTASGSAPLSGDAGPAGSARATSRKDYVAELTKAHRNREPEAVLSEITAARHRGRAQGL